MIPVNSSVTYTYGTVCLVRIIEFIGDDDRTQSPLHSLTHSLSYSVGRIHHQEGFSPPAVVTAPFPGADSAHIIDTQYALTMLDSFIPPSRFTVRRDYELLDEVQSSHESFGAVFIHIYLHVC